MHICNEGRGLFYYLEYIWGIFNLFVINDFE